MNTKNQYLKQEFRKNLTAAGIYAFLVLILAFIFNAPSILIGLAGVSSVFFFSGPMFTRIGRRDGFFHFYHRRDKSEIYLIKPDTESIQSVIHWHGYEGDSFDILWSDGTSWYVPEDSGFSLKYFNRLLSKVGLSGYPIEERHSVYRPSFEMQRQAEQGAAANP